MDKILATLFQTSWGRSIIGWTCIASFAFTSAMGWAYLGLFSDYKALELRAEMEREAINKKLEECWKLRHQDLVGFHQRQDTLELINNKKRRR